MGVKGLFGGYIMKKHRDCVQRTRPENTAWDFLLIDLNGIIHTACAQVYGYGEPPKDGRRLLSAPSTQTPREKTVKDVERAISDRLRTLIRMTTPIKGVFIAIDGVAPVSKQCQQRARRYRTAMTRGDDCPFDSNSITPGTEFLYSLSYYINMTLRNRLATEFPHLEFYLANQAVAGEGEHKAIQFIRKRVQLSESYIIYGMDADLINLALACPAERVYIVREVMQGSSNYNWVDISTIRTRIQTDMFWQSMEYACEPDGFIRDFVILGYLLGNDFLPQVKSLDIYEGAIDNMISAYTEYAPSNGHLVIRRQSSWAINKLFLKRIMECLQTKEHENLANVALGKDSRHVDALQQECLILSANPSPSDFNYRKYISLYAEKKLKNNAKDAVMCYMEGMEWIVNYYLDGPRSWTWYYPYHYAPLLHHFVEHMDVFTSVSYQPTRPHAPVLQLISVLPPKSANLIPEPFRSMILSSEFSLKDQYPTSVDVDLGGCKAEWEGTVLTPFLNQRAITKIYLDNSRHLSDEAKKRNIAGRVFRYVNGNVSFYDM